MLAELHLRPEGGSGTAAVFNHASCNWLQQYGERNQNGKPSKGGCIGVNHLHLVPTSQDSKEGPINAGSYSLPNIEVATAVGLKGDTWDYRLDRVLTLSPVSPMSCVE